MLFPELRLVATMSVEGHAIVVDDLASLAFLRRQWAGFYETSRGAEPEA